MPRYLYIEARDVAKLTREESPMVSFAHCVVDTRSMTEAYTKGHMLMSAREVDGRRKDGHYQGVRLNDYVIKLEDLIERG